MNKMIIMAGGKGSSVVLSVCATGDNTVEINQESFEGNSISDFRFLKRSQHQQQGRQYNEDPDANSSKNRFEVFILLESFLNLCYYLLLIPIRISINSDGSYKIRRNFIQKILSTLFILIITIFSLLDLRHYQRQQNVRDRPDETFKYATIFIIHWIPLCWIIIFWLRSDRFARFLDICCAHGDVIVCKDNNVLRKSHVRLHRFGLILKIAMFLTMTKNFLLFYNEINSSHEGSLLHYLDSVTDRFLYDFGLHSTLENKADWPKLMIFISYAAGAIHFMLEFVIYMFDQLCFTAAIMVFATCQTFLDKFHNLITSIKDHPNNEDDNGENHSSVLKEISTSYLNLTTVLDGINGIFGPCIVMFFMYLYPLFIWSVFDSVQNNSLIENFLRVHDMLVLCVVTGTAAEASSKVELFRQWLFEAAISNLPDGNDNNNALLRLTTMHREVSSEAVGLKGYKFFTVTYRFVATMIGVVITYAIVMFQLIMDPKRGNNNSTTEATLHETANITTIMSDCVC